MVTLHKSGSNGDMVWVNMGTEGGIYLISNQRSQEISELNGGS